jgi:hypothetical protein
MRWAEATGGGVLVAALLTACAGGQATTTTGQVPVSTTIGSAELAGGSTTTQAPVLPVPSPASTTILVAGPSYRIVDRLEGDDGDIVVVLLDPSTYDALTDIDLQNVVEDIVEHFPPVLTMYVVDAPDAADVVLQESDAPTEEGQAILGDHYLVRLEDGFRLVYQGPFSSTRSVIIGS